VVFSAIFHAVKHTLTKNSISYETTRPCTAH